MKDAVGLIIAPGIKLAGADLTHVKLAPDLSNERMACIASDLSEGDLSHASLRGPDLSYAKLPSAKLNGSNLNGGSWYRPISAWRI